MVRFRETIKQQHVSAKMMYRDLFISSENFRSYLSQNHKTSFFIILMKQAYYSYMEIKI